MMARVTLMCLLLLTSSLHHVTSFAVRRRHSRSTDLAEALRMLERQRHRIDQEESLLTSSPQLLGDRRFAMAGLPSWLNSAADSPSQNEVNAQWLAKTLGLDGYGGLERLPEDSEEDEILADVVKPAPVQVEPTDQELDSIFGEKIDDDDGLKTSLDLQKKDKESMSDVAGDAKSIAEASSAAEVIVSPESDGTVSDDVRLTKDEFKALLKAVEKLQKQAIDKVEEDAEEAQEVAEQVEEKVAEARQEAKEADGEAKMLTPKPQPVSKEELDNLFEEKTEVIPTEDGGIIKTEKTVTDAAGIPVGKEETVEQVESIPNKGTLSSIEDFWYLNNYLGQDGDRKKRNSRFTPIPPAAAMGGGPPDVMSSLDTADLIEAYVNKINELQTELDQVRLVSYLEDMENDILTNALNEATVAQVEGHINPAELNSLQDAIRVEEALQHVKSNRVQAATLANQFADQIASEMEMNDGEKRGEPWKKRSNVMQSEIPIYVTGDSDDVSDDDDDDSEEETAVRALGQLLYKNPRKLPLDKVFEVAPMEPAYLADRLDDDLIRDSASGGVASLFSNNADQCPAVMEFSTNCQFAGDSIDFEARALCNVHEMCYACGQTLEVAQGQCDFIYRAAATMLCHEEEECVLEADVFLNAMKLKHRFVPYPQQICRSRCTAQFLSIV